MKQREQQTYRMLYRCAAIALAYMSLLTRRTIYNKKLGFSLPETSPLLYTNVQCPSVLALTAPVLTAVRLMSNLSYLRLAG